MQGLSDSAIFAQVIVAIETTFCLPSLVYHPSSLLKDDLSIGWFGRLKLVILLEEMFDVEFPDDTVAHLTTLSDIVVFLRHWVGPLAPVIQRRHAQPPQPISGSISGQPRSGRPEAGRISHPR